MNDFENNLCLKNKELLAEVKKSIDVQFEKWEKDHWGAKITKNDTVGIVYYPEKFSDAKIAHELLHLKIGSIMGHNGYLAIYAQLYHPLNLIFTNEVLTHLLNSYEHMKIIKEYRNLGFSDEDFFDEDVNRNQTLTLLETIRNGNFYKNGGYSITNIFFYITSTISFLSYPLDSNKWKKELKILERACKPLYKILENYWNTILKIPINNKGKDMLNIEHKVFINNLSNWFKHTKVY